MSFSFGNPEYRFGSAAFVTRAELKKAGMFEQTDSAIYCGLFEGKPLFYDCDGGAIIIGGARSGKLTTILAQNICHGIGSGASNLILDMKGELAAISQNQTPDQKYCYYWNPLGLHGLPQHKVNPVDYLRWSSPSLYADVKVLVESLIPRSGAANSEYFELRGREYLEAICLVLIKINGVLTLPDLYRAINLIPLNNERWKDLAREMRFSGISLCQRVEEEIHASRQDSSGGSKGIIGEMFKALACLSDPVLLESVSPPFDFSLADPCSSGQLVNLYMICPAETVEVWAPVIKSNFTGAMIYKSRRPNSPRQNWILDECGQLSNYELVAKMFSYGAGIGIRPLAVFQTTSQMENLGKKAKDIIMSSAALQMYFSVRDLPSAETVSKMLGAATLDYDDPVQQGRAEIETRDVLRNLLSGTDPFQDVQKLIQKSYESRHLSKQRRLLNTPDEVLNTPSDRMFLFADGLSGPVYAERAPYWTQRFMAGRYHPNPYHPPHDNVQVQTYWGRRTRKVITQNVPEEFADYPQYRSGKWSFIEGY